MRGHLHALRGGRGILVGSYSTGFILCCSETHPLPYMPTRPFRVNAGALHSYVLGPENRTNYLSELRSGSTTLAVNAEGRTRRVVVGRAKLESRPLLTITARSAEGVVVSLTVQDDWHVRVLGPGGKVLNVTELRQGDELLGHLATDQRHVGYPIGEFCRRPDGRRHAGPRRGTARRPPGELPYLVHGDDTQRRAAVRDAVNFEAAVFAEHGIGEGSTVMLQTPPSYTQVEVVLALWRLGAQVMLLDHRLKASEVEALRASCRPQFMVDTGTAGRSPLGFEARYELVTTRRADGRPAATDHRLVQFSSGSTGLPKVIGRTAESLAAEIERFSRIEGMPVRGERVLLLSSTAHSFGLIAGCCTPWRRASRWSSRGGCRRATSWPPPNGTTCTRCSARPSTTNC
ncbi:3-dehydroquinate synthase II [Streptomyces sp. M19]